MSAEHSVLFDMPGPKARRRHTIMNMISIVVLALIAVWIVLKIGEAGEWDGRRWGAVFEWRAWQHYFLPGVYNTLLASVISVVLAFVFGMVFGVGRLSSNRLIRWFSGIVVEFFRAVPVLILMIGSWTVLARSGLIPPSQSPLYGVIIGLTLYNGAVIAELVRSGVYGLPRGQREAALAIGMTRTQSIRSVELPQALLAMLPALVSQFVIILKDSALGYIITFSELLRSAELLGTQFPLPVLQSLVVASAVFILLNYGLTKIAERLTGLVSSRTSGKTKPAGQAPGASVMAPTIGVPIDQEPERDPTT